MVAAYVLVQTEVGRAADVARALAGIAGVVESEEVSGPYDVVVRVETEDAAHLTSTVVPLITGADGIARTLTCPVVTDIRAS